MNLAAVMLLSFVVLSKFRFIGTHLYGWICYGAFSEAKKCRIDKAVVQDVPQSILNF